MKNLVINIVNKSSSKIEFNDNLFVLKKFDNMTMIDYDPKVLNEILSNISNNIYDNIKLIEKKDYNILNKYDIDKNIFYIPTGIIFNSVFFNNLGPKIPIKLKLINSVNPNIETKVSEYGINNSLIEVNIKIPVDFRVILPVSSKEMHIEITVPLTVKIIQGDIPDYYFDNLIKKK